MTEAEKKAEAKKAELLENIKTQNEEQNKAFKAEMQQLVDDVKKDAITNEDLTAKLDELSKKLEGNESEELKALKQEVEDAKKEVETLNEDVKAYGTDIKKLQSKGLINGDFTVNKSVLRTLVETHLKDGGFIQEPEKDKNGIKIKEVKVKSEKFTKSHVVNMSGIANKAGENMYLNGTTTGSVFNQAINRTPFGEIAPPLTSDQHALDIFSVSQITGSLMTLMIFENLEANGELVDEGVAPSADSRIEKTSKDFKVFNFAATATVSKDLLRDSGELVNELVRQLQDDLKTKLDNVLFVSTGDNTATPWGAFNTANSCENFNPLLFTGTSKKANTVSIIGKAKLQARLNKWATDSTILNPYQWDELEDLKDLNENSVRDNRLAVGSLGEIIAVKGLRQYQTTKMPQGSLIVFNSPTQAIGLRQDIETEFGHNGTDLKDRKVSFIMDMRGAYGQKAKKSSIYVTSISDAIAILKESATASITRTDGYATGSDATALTIATLINTGAVNVIESKLADYKTGVAGATGVANLAALQAIIDAA